MTKYKKIPTEEQAILTALKIEFDDCITATKNALNTTSNFDVNETSSRTITTCNITNANFVIFKVNDNNLKIINNMMDFCNDCYVKALEIKKKYGYDDVRTFRTPTYIDKSLMSPEIITLSVNQSLKIRPFQEEKIQEWTEKNYRGFGDLWSLIGQCEKVNDYGFSYIANDFRCRVRGDEQKSLNNGIFIGVGDDTKTVLNVRINPSKSVKRQDYLGDQRTYFTVENPEKKILKIYSKNESEESKNLLNDLKDMYSIKFEI